MNSVPRAEQVYQLAQESRDLLFEGDDVAVVCTGVVIVTEWTDENGTTWFDIACANPAGKELPGPRLLGLLEAAKLLAAKHWLDPDD